MGLRVGLIGFGVMGKNYARVLKKLERKKLCYFVSIADQNKNLKEEAEKYAKFYNNFQRMIKEENLEAICIVAPAQYNSTITKKCINLGIKNLLVEKPIVTLAKLDEGYELLKISNKRKIKIMSADIICYDPATIALKNNIQKLGKIKAILTIRFGKYPYRFTEVGVNEDLLVHDITFARFILNWQKFYIKNLIKSTMFRENQIDFTAIEAVSKKNVKLISTVTWLSEEKIRLAVVLGEEKIAQVNFLNGKKYVKLLPKEMVKKVNLEMIKELEKEKFGEKLILEKYEPLEKEIMHFIDTVKNEKEPVTNLQRALETLEMLYPTI